jgi:transcription elongation GreA/GreB family factor
MRGRRIRQSARRIIKHRNAEIFDMGDKAALRDAIIAQLEAELATLTSAANGSREEATDQESRQEGKYDMRAQSAAYLAAGQAKLATELGEAVAAYRNLGAAAVPAGAPATTGTLIVLQSGAREQWYYLGPARGGMEVFWEGQAVTVITPGSPLGRLLLGKRAGETTARGLIASLR